VTDRFHGSVFSLKNGTPVMAVDCTEGTYTQAGWSKKSCLLKEFHLDQTNHINTGSGMDIDEILQRADSIISTFDGDAVRRKIDEFRRRFHDFLNRVAKVLEA
jgi:polysaccharide pyruvyl transferase WcaK-like protein